MRAPEFWLRECWQARLLAPAAWLYGRAAMLRERHAHPVAPPVPVLCIGNLTAGGAGKTPVAIAAARLLLAAGRRPFFLSRGHGGALAGPLRVDPARHASSDTGDEPLLLARVAPAIVARDRVAGARLAAAEGADCIVMDDGLQNPSLAKTLRLVVVDGATGFGNGRAMPAGPLRAPLAHGLSLADGFALVGVDRRGLAASVAARAPVLRATLEPSAEDAARLRGRRLLAFAGIGRPAKFFATLEGCGAELVAREGFADHHPYREDEVAALRARAEAIGAALATTEKDMVRIPPSQRRGILVLPVEARFAPADALRDFIGGRLDG
ncbi:MAG: tetraacyldisaccharide 4'-kinase [Alphaproteobacteria bacterium]